MVRIVSVFGNYSQLIRPLHKLEVRGTGGSGEREGIYNSPIGFGHLHWSPDLTDSLLSEEMEGVSRGGISGTASIAKRQLALRDWELEQVF